MSGYMGSQKPTDKNREEISRYGKALPAVELSIAGPLSEVGFSKSNPCKIPTAESSHLFKAPLYTRV